MSMQYEVNGNSFVHKIRPEPVDEATNSVFLHERRRSNNRSRGFFRTLRNTFTSCSPFSERHVIDVPPSIKSVEYNWSKRVMADSVEERNTRLSSCHIPNLKPTIHYLNAVRKHQGQTHSEIDAAEKELPELTRHMLNSNYAQVMAGNSIAAFEEAIVIHEVLMFKGAHAIPSYDLKSDSTAQSPRFEECAASKELPINSLPCIDAIHILQMIQENDVETAYQLLEQICYEQSGTHTFNDDVTYITKRLNIPEDDINSFVEQILKNGRQHDFSSHHYQMLLLQYKDRLSRPRQSLATPKERSINELNEPFQRANIILLPQKTQCNICYETTTIFETSCCSLHTCLSCLSKNIEAHGIIAFESWINRCLMIECQRCDSPINLGVYEQELSETAQRILSYFHQQYIANLYLIYSNGIPVFCDDDNCREAYTISHDQLYFQCDKIERHADQRVRLHHSICKTLWTHEHNCPQGQKRRTIEKIDNIKYMTQHIDYVMPCIGNKKNNCTALIEKSSGCNNIQCIKCGTIFCWYCEQEWSYFHLPCNNHPNSILKINRQKRLKQLNLTLANLKQHQKSPKKITTQVAIDHPIFE